MNSNLDEDAQRSALNTSLSEELWTHSGDMSFTCDRTPSLEDLWEDSYLSQDVSIEVCYDSDEVLSPSNSIVFLYEKIEID